MTTKTNNPKISDMTLSQLLKALRVDLVENPIPVKPTPVWIRPSKVLPRSLPQMPPEAKRIIKKLVKTVATEKAKRD